jgi:hypothetical protein
MSRRSRWLALLLTLLLAAPGWAQAKKKLLLVGQGPDGHPPETHEYLPGIKVLGRCLEKSPTWKSPPSTPPAPGRTARS